MILELLTSEYLCLFGFKADQDPVPSSVLSLKSAPLELLKELLNILTKHGTRWDMSCLLTPHSTSVFHGKVIVKEKIKFHQQAKQQIIGCSEMFLMSPLQKLPQLLQIMQRAGVY